MITRNGKAPIDFDFNLFIENGMRYNCKELKEYIMNIFNEILKNKKWRASKDSTSVITTGPKYPKMDSVIKPDEKDPSVPKTGKVR